MAGGFIEEGLTFGEVPAPRRSKRARFEFDDEGLYLPKSYLSRFFLLFKELTCPRTEFAVVSAVMFQPRNSVRP